MQCNVYKWRFVKKIPALAVAALLALALCACGNIKQLIGIDEEEDDTSALASRDDALSASEDETSVEVPDTAAEFFETSPVPGGVAVSGYTGTESVVKIPRSLGGGTVVAVSEGAFKDSDGGDGVAAVSVTEVIVPSTVTEMARGAFSGCKRLASLTVPFAGGSADGHAYIGYLFGAGSPDGNINALPDSLEKLTVGGATVHEKAFFGCERVKSLVFTEAVTVENNAFEDCSGLKTLVLPDSVKSIGSDVFKDCSSLETLRLPYFGNGSDKLFFGAVFGASDYTENLKYVPSSLRTVSVPCPESLPEGAFYECRSITELELRGNLKTVGEKAFYRCRRLRSINVGYDGYKGISSVAGYSFGYCASLTEIRLSENVAPLPEGAFYACSSLRTIRVGDAENTLPESHTDIGVSAFAYCENLPFFTLPGRLSEIKEKLFYGCTHLEEITVPASVKSIGDKAFMGCSSLGAVTVQTEGLNGASSVGEGAFSYCASLKSLTLPGCVAEIGDNAFAFSGIEELSLEGANVRIGADVFAGCDDFLVDVDPSSETYRNLVGAGLGNSHFK